MRHLLHLVLVPLAYEGQVLGVALFQRRQQGCPEVAYLAGEFERLLDQHHATHRADRLVQAAENAPDVNPRGCCLDQHAGVDRGIEQRERPHDAGDVLAVADFEEPIGDGIPIPQQLVVFGNAEVEGATDAEQRTGVAGIAIRLWSRCAQVEGDLTFQVDQRIANRSESFRL